MMQFLVYQLHWHRLGFQTSPEKKLSVLKSSEHAGQETGVLMPMANPASRIISGQPLTHFITVM
jgi:hypothetical protein